MQDPRQSQECPPSCPTNRSGQAMGNPPPHNQFHQNGNQFVVERVETGMEIPPGAYTEQIPSNYEMEYAHPMDLNERSSRSLDQYGINAPRMPAQSTPIHPYNLPPRHDTCGSQIDYNLSWMPQDVELPDLVESRSRRRQKGLPAKYLQRDLNMDITSTIDYNFYDESSGGRQPGLLPKKYLQKDPNMDNSSTVDSNVFEQDQSSDINVSFFQSKGKGDSTEKRSPKHESLLEWFDRTVEKELHKRRIGSLNVGENLVNLETPTSVKDKTPSPSHASKLLFIEASTSGIDIASKLRMEQNTELLEAVDKLAKAEAMISFEGAVRAAEEAAAAAPPEFAEEAAGARAQDFQAELTGVIKQEFTGLKPIEVIGYVGITRPKKPKKSKCTC